MAEPQPKQPFTNELIHGFADYMDVLRSEIDRVRLSNIDLMDIHKLAPNTYILDINHDTSEWVFRFMGTKLVQDFGQDLTGKDLHSVIQGDTKGTILDTIARVIDKKKPVWSKVTATPVPDKKEHSSKPKTVAYERAAYPLFGDTDRVDHVIGLAVIYPFSRDLHTSEIIELP